MRQNDKTSRQSRRDRREVFTGLSSCSQDQSKILSALEDAEGSCWGTDPSQQLRELSLQSRQHLPFARAEPCRALVCCSYHFWLGDEGS